MDETAVENQPEVASQGLLRELPSVDRLLQFPIASEMARRYGHQLTAEALRNALESQRTAIRAGQRYVSMPASLVHDAQNWLETLLAPTLHPVINGTGIIVHTNLGRAPLSQAAVTAVNAVGASYSTLEYDLTEGKRGTRAVHAEQLLTRLTGAEAAMVVNNNAAAVLLMLATLCHGKEVIISRGQLVEIGGGFRIPDVMAQSGARLVEVGTTNRTHLGDYSTAVNENTSAIMVAHHSNFKIVGFATEPSLVELAELAHEHRLPLLYDQGSGAMADVTLYGLDPEPTVPDALQAGCDLVAFSGDKLLGGPQAGILCGRSDLIGRLKKHPLARAVRADKMCLAALAATLLPYLTEQFRQEIPVWRMIARSLDDIEREATAWAAQLREGGVQAQVCDGRSMVGGGSLPGTSLPSKLVGISGTNVTALAATLRTSHLPVIGRIHDDSFTIDPRTVLPGQSEALMQALSKRFQETNAG